MIKKLTMNGMPVPIPVPISDLEEAVSWICETLVKKDHSLTSVVLDGLEIDLDSQEKWPKRELNSDHVLEIRVESPFELALQSLDTIRTLAFAINGVLPGMAVHLWEYAEKQIPVHMQELWLDIELLMDLDSHLSQLMDAGIIDLAPVHANCRLSRRVGLALKESLAKKMWKEAAKILLNRLEPIVRDLVAESETIQIQLIAQGCGGHSLAKAGAR